MKKEIEIHFNGKLTARKEKKEIYLIFLIRFKLLSETHHIGREIKIEKKKNK